jgi:hypothetical protein
MKILPHLYRTLDWMEVYQTDRAPLIDIPAHAIAKISTPRMLKFVFEAYQCKYLLLLW